MDDPISILFVCMGNICRSPLAQGIFQSVVHEQRLADRFMVDSAGTGGWHVGDPPDPRARHVASTHGIDISTQQCRQIGPHDFNRFDLILAMDQNNLTELKRACPAQCNVEIDLFMAYAGLGQKPVPDPYYGGDAGFETVFQMLRTGAEAMVPKLV